MGKAKPLMSIARSYFEQDPIAATRALEAMSDEDVISVLRSLPLSVSIEAFWHMNASRAAALLTSVSPILFGEIASHMHPRQVAAVFFSLPQELRPKLLEELSEKSRAQVKEYLTFPMNSAGRIMSTEFISLRSDLKVREAVRKIRQMSKKKVPSSYIYVVDDMNHLVGVINMRDMMLALGNQMLSEVMHKEVFSVNSFMDREEVANQMSDRRYFAVPVVDAESRLLGIVHSQSLLEHVQEGAAEDIQKMFGAGGDETPFSTVAFSVKKRLPWLHINLLTAFMAAFVVSFFEDIIAKVTILAVFLPVVAGQGGNAGAQSLAVVMRGLVMREIPKEKAGKMILKETMTGLLNGIIIGAVTAGVAYLWHGNPWLGLVIGLAMVATLVIAGLSGAAIPMIMKGLGFDPAQSSNIILTTITDITGFFAFLGLAVVFKNYLI